MTKYICRDCSGWALQFTGSGRNIQCSTVDADRFDTREQAESALIKAEKFGGDIEPITFDSFEHPDATDGDSVTTMRDLQ